MSNIPADLVYAKSHEWLRAAADGTATIGITDYAQSSLGDITFVQLPKVGATLKAGETFGVVESIKAVSDLYAPVSGKVVEVHSDLVSDPGRINSQPHTEWMLVVEASDAKAQFDGLMDADAYQEYVRSL